MSRREAERLADALWRVVRPSLLSVLAAQEDSETSDELRPEDEARIDACVARLRKRARQPAAHARSRKAS